PPLPAAAAAFPAAPAVSPLRARAPATGAGAAGSLTEPRPPRLAFETGAAARVRRPAAFAVAAVGTGAVSRVVSRLGAGGAVGLARGVGVVVVIARSSRP